MRINPSNSTTVSWRTRADVRPEGVASAQKSVQKMRKISPDRRVSADEPAKHDGTEKLSSPDKKSAKRASSTYALVNTQDKQVGLDFLSPNNQVKSNRDNNDTAASPGYAGRVNSHLNQSAISTYRSHQFLDKRDEIMSSFGVSEFA